MILIISQQLNTEAIMCELFSWFFSEIKIAIKHNNTSIRNEVPGVRKPVNVHLFPRFSLSTLAIITF